MPRRKSAKSPDSSSRPLLSISLEDFHSTMQERISAGEETKNLLQTIHTESELDDWQGRFTNWDDYNHEWLQSAEQTGVWATEYLKSWGIQFASLGGPTRLRDRVERSESEIQSKIQRLQSIDNRASLAGMPRPTVPPSSPAGSQVDKAEVFVVHGRDEAARERVARFIDRLKLKAVILHEQSNRGRTLFEKVLDHAPAAFAVVILTPDDIGYLAGHPEEAAARSRENVVFELGLFIGLLGRTRVVVLKHPTVSAPSDIEGLVYIELDDKGAWEAGLARELRSAELPVDVAAWLNP